MSTELETEPTVPDAPTATGGGEGTADSINGGPGVSSADTIPVDGRNLRGIRTRATILAACRAMMLAGDFRPTMLAVARNAKCSVRSVFTHFDDVEALHLAALDRDTQDGILQLIMPGMWAPAPAAIVWAAVFGRPFAPVAADA